MYAFSFTCNPFWRLFGLAFEMRHGIVFKKRCMNKKKKKYIEVRVCLFILYTLLELTEKGAVSLSRWCFIVSLQKDTKR